MTSVVFIDTNVLCNILKVPGRDQQAADVQDDFRRRLGLGQSFVLPSATLIETGNFVAQASGDRRGAAQRFATMVQQIADGRAPWRLNQPTWDEATLQRLLAGAGSGQALVDLLANRQLGLGDLSIIDERDQFVSNSHFRSREVEIGRSMTRSGPTHDRRRQ